MTDRIPIDDLFEDIIAKSMRGHRITEAELAASTGVSADNLARLCRGEWWEGPEIAKVAEALKLDADALMASASSTYYPKPVQLEGLELFNTAYRDMTVNSFLIWDPATMMAGAFDTGTDTRPMIE
ncbi:MAG: helix-turn-helix domain-containing protein, partial [Verrucomicrobiota bacterium]